MEGIPIQVKKWLLKKKVSLFLDNIIEEWLRISPFKKKAAQKYVSISDAIKIGWLYQ